MKQLKPRHILYLIDLLSSRNVELSKIIDFVENTAPEKLQEEYTKKYHKEKAFIVAISRKLEKEIHP